jgi:phosphatidylserine decarboxylase
LFKFGGSCVVTLFQPGKIKLDADLVEQSAAGLEVYARMGERLGEAV